MTSYRRRSSDEKTKNFSVSFSPEMLKIVDEIAIRENRSRSFIIEMLVREALAKEQKERGKK